MDWYHEVDPEWLAARKHYLCASDIVKLLPVTPTGRPRTNTTAAYLGVWADKQCALDLNDVRSRGAMARGHLLEPYAIQDANVARLFRKELFHWDDKLICRNGVSCSPDALSIPMTPEMGKVIAHNTIKPSLLVEVKSYAAAAHYELGGYTPKETIVERWQIATALFVMPTLKEGALLFYHPGAKHPMFRVMYDRKDLAGELEMVEDIRTRYFDMADGFEKDFDARCASLHCTSEADIIAELEDIQRLTLNP